MTFHQLQRFIAHMEKLQAPKIGKLEEDKFSSIYRLKQQPKNTKEYCKMQTPINV